MMRNPLLTTLIVLALFALYGTGHAADQPGKLPLLTTVFEKQRSEKEDVIYFRNNDILRGTVLNETLGINAPYGSVTVELRKCAGVSFEGSRANTEALVTVNRNRLTGIITDRVIRFRIGSSGEVIDIRKEKVRFILLRQLAKELDFIDPDKRRDLFVMTNGDLLTGTPAEKKIAITTDYGTVNLSFAEIRKIEMQGGDNVTAVITKKNKDVMRGTLETEEITLGLDLGVSVDAVYKDKFATLFIEHVPDEMMAQFGMFQPVGGESEGAAFPSQTSGDKISNSLGMEFALIPAGSFTMGSPFSETGRQAHEGPQHKVTITHSFYMQTTEVTQEQWYRVMKTTVGAQGKSSYAQGANLPMYNVSWNDAREFCKKLSAMDSKTYRLPTEAEWEYACRAGTTSRYYWGNDPNNNEIGRYAWYSMNSDNMAHGVATKKPNAWGLFDMVGNISEWCSDWYDPNIYPPISRTDPQGATDGKIRICRGGFWGHPALACRSAYRYSGIARTPYNGFRIVLDLN